MVAVVVLVARVEVKALQTLMAVVRNVGVPVVVIVVVGIGVVVVVVVVELVWYILHRVVGIVLCIVNTSFERGEGC